MAKPTKLPAHWPRYTTEKYYVWMMAQMPPGAIAADWSKHKPHHSYSPLFWYVDTVEECIGCGKSFVFTKEQQKHWYEELKIPIYAQANRCPSCRKTKRDKLSAQKLHMKEKAQRTPHPNEAFFKKKKILGKRIKTDAD